MKHNDSSCVLIRHIFLFLYVHQTFQIVWQIVIASGTKHTKDPKWFYNLIRLS